MLRPLAKLPVAPVLLVLLLSGCAGTRPISVHSIDDVPTNAPTEAGDGDSSLLVRIVEETGNGTPLKDAAVLAYKIPEPLHPPTMSELRKQNSTFALRTDGQGEAHARVKRGAIYSFVVAAPNRTVEARHLVKMDDQRLRSGLLIALYKDHLTLELKGQATTIAKVAKIPGSGPSSSCNLICGSDGQAQFWFQNVSFHPNPTVSRAYLYRLSDTSAKLTWQNSPTSYADLGVRFGFWDSVEWFDQDANTELPTDAGSETLKIAHPYLIKEAQKKGSVFAVGAISRSSVIAPNGVPFRITLDADFTTDSTEAYTCAYNYPNPYKGSPYCSSEAGFEGLAAFVALAFASSVALWRRTRPKA